MARDPQTKLSKHFPGRTKQQTFDDLKKIADMQKKTFNTVLNIAIEKFISEYRAMGVIQ